ncbi:Glucan 1,6-alpha-isomaltosidase family protein, partial [Striga asiatica]
VLNWMLRKHGLRHCVQSNVLTAPVAVWDDIFEPDPFSVAYQYSGDPRWPDIRFLFTVVYEDTSNPPVLLDQNSTNENDVATLNEQSYVFSLTSLTNAPVNEREASSKASLNTHTNVSIQRWGVEHHCAFPDHHVSRRHLHAKDLLVTHQIEHLS